MLKLLATAIGALAIAVGIAAVTFYVLQNACSSGNAFVKTENTTQPERPNEDAKNPDSTDKSGSPNGEYAKPATFEFRVTEPDKIEGRYHAKESGGNESEWVHKFICEIKIGEFSVAAFTLFLVIFTGLLWGSTHKLWSVTVATLQHAERTAIRELRAYVSINKILMDQFRYPGTMGANQEIPGPIHSYPRATISGTSY